MISELSYFITEVVSITLLALLALCFVISKPRNINALMIALICLGTISYLLTRMNYNPNPAFKIDLSAYWLPMQLLMNMPSGLWMILCYSLFQDMKRFPLWILGIYIFQLCLSTLRPLFVPNALVEIDVASIGELTYFVFGNLPIMLQSLFALVATYWIIKGWQGDLVESRRQMRLVFLGLISFMYFAVGLTELYQMNADSGVPILANNIITFGIAALNISIALVCLRTNSAIDRLVEINRETQAEDSGPLDNDDEYKADLQDFYRLFRDQKAYLEPGLSIADLAKIIRTPQYKLRALINKRLGYRNFNALLNEYRIEDACEQFMNPDNRQLPILTIALTVGYQSIAPFNQAFRELKDQTPTEFRKKSQREITSNEETLPESS